MTGLRDKLTLGTPMKMLLFREASRIFAAMSKRLGRLKRVSEADGSDRVAKRYKSPTEEGVFTVRSEHVCMEDEIYEHKLRYDLS